MKKIHELSPEELEEYADKLERRTDRLKFFTAIGLPILTGITFFTTGRFDFFIGFMTGMSVMNLITYKKSVFLKYLTMDIH